MLVGTDASIPDEICSGIPVEHSGPGNVWKGSIFFSSVIFTKCFSPGSFIGDIRHWVEPPVMVFSRGLESRNRKQEIRNGAILLMDFLRHGGLSSDEVSGGARD